MKKLMKIADLQQPGLTKATLANMKTRCVGQVDDLKLEWREEDTGVRYRVWISRVTNGLSAESNTDGTWRTLPSGVWLETPKGPVRTDE